MTSESDKPSDAGSVRMPGTVLMHAIDEFVRNIGSLGSSYSDVVHAVRSELANAENKWVRFVEKNELGERKSGVHAVVKLFSPFPPDHWHEYRQLWDEWQKRKIACLLVPRSFLVSLTSLFDFFLNCVLEFAFSVQPKLMSDKELSYEKLMEFQDMDHAHVYIIKKTAAEFLRESRETQFSRLDKLLKVKLQPDSKTWADFIELNERRHLFVHCDGRVNEEYITKCKKHSVELPPDINLDTVLPITDEYFQHGCSNVIEVGIKLAQVVWRKLLPDDIKADSSFTDVCYQRIVDEDYDLAIRLLDFAVHEPSFKFHTNSYELRNQLNLAQAYKWKGQEERCKQILEEIDWSSTKPLFCLAKSGLEENYQEAVRIFHEVGANSSEVDKSYYRDWPIFKSLRERPEFAEAFEQVYKEPLIKPEPVELDDSGDESP